MTRRVAPILRSRDVGAVEAELHNSDAPLRLPTSRLRPYGGHPAPLRRAEDTGYGRTDRGETRR